jgi:NADPH:quinone reductase-like Zn-dependent oxidoreductase
MEMPADQYALYAEFGITAEKAQVLEVSAASVALISLALFVKTDEISPEETEMYRAVVDDVNSKTFGKLLTHLKKRAKLDDAIIKALKDALDARNYLTHHFFRSHNFALYSEEGRKVMMAELKSIQKKLNLADQFLQTMWDLMNDLRAKLLSTSAVDANETALRLQERGKRVDI